MDERGERATTAAPQVDDRRPGPDKRLPDLEHQLPHRGELRDRSRQHVVEDARDLLVEGPRAVGIMTERARGAVHACTGGRRSAQGRAASSWAASRNNLGSSPRLPRKCVPIGSPSRFQWSGTDMAAPPVTLARTPGNATNWFSRARLAGSARSGTKRADLVWRVCERRREPEVVVDEEMRNGASHALERFDREEVVGRGNALSDLPVHTGDGFELVVLRLTPELTNPVAHDPGRRRGHRGPERFAEFRRVHDVGPGFDNFVAELGQERTGAVERLDAIGMYRVAVGRFLRERDAESTRDLLPPPAANGRAGGGAQ